MKAAAPSTRPLVLCPVATLHLHLPRLLTQRVMGCPGGGEHRVPGLVPPWGALSVGLGSWALPASLVLLHACRDLGSCAQGQQELAASLWLAQILPRGSQGAWPWPAAADVQGPEVPVPGPLRVAREQGGPSSRMEPSPRPWRDSSASHSLPQESKAGHCPGAAGSVSSSWVLHTFRGAVVGRHKSHLHNSPGAWAGGRSCPALL